MTSVDLSGCNTLELPSRADRVAVVSQLDELRELLAAAGGSHPLWLLGGGSNVILKPHVAGTLVLMRMRGLSWLRTPGGHIHLTVAAGERWHDVVRFALGQGWSGLENLALIPGLAGAAPIQNIGAYGVELSDRLVSLSALGVDCGELRTFACEDCEFGYRDSRFKGADAGRYVIVSITLRLQETPELVLDYPDLRAELARMGRSNPSPVDVAEAVIRVRRRKLPDPRVCANAGSFFKNPLVTRAHAETLARQDVGLTLWSQDGDRVKLSAAQLIDRCGWKGRRLGRAGVWHRQPLVLVNLGSATAADLLVLADAIRRDVAERYGVELELEPRVLGQD